ncbi:hypothetical protein A2U01_0056525, partial [Trifolium medium]|nr:hypothetical protein [Trifolium medium]
IFNCFSGAVATVASVVGTVGFDSSSVASGAAHLVSTPGHSLNYFLFDSQRCSDIAPVSAYFPYSLLPHLTEDNDQLDDLQCT